MTPTRIYLDNNATTKPLPEVTDAMLPYLQEEYANPSSIHQFGQSVKHAIECARQQTAGLIGAEPAEILFTASGTESINLALRGLLALRPHKRRIVTTAIEHSATLRVVEQLAREGYEIDLVGVNAHGQMDESRWELRLTDDTALASIIHANNETGVLQDVEKLAAMADRHGVPVHVDAVQSAGKIPIDITRWPAALMSFAAHKFHGPKGVGSLYVRKRTRLKPLILGGNQERNLRAGTEAVPQIVGMGVACQAAGRDMTIVSKRIESLRDRFEQGVLRVMPNTRVNGRSAPRIHNTSNFSFPGLSAEALLILLSEAGVCASSGSACSSGSLEPSHVLQAMGLDESLVHSAIRFSLSRFTTEEEIDQVLNLLPTLVSRLTTLTKV